jgi:hypothetical protein
VSRVSLSRVARRKKANPNGIVPEKPRPQHIDHRRGTEGHPGVAAIGLLNGVHAQETNRVDRQLIQLRWIET